MVRSPSIVEITKAEEVEYLKAKQIEYEVETECIIDEYTSSRSNTNSPTKETVEIEEIFETNTEKIQSNLGKL
jgi:hypothetical protein